MKNTKQILDKNKVNIIDGDDLEVVLRKKEARKTREMVERFQLEERALEIAARDGDDSSTISTGTGQVVMGNRSGRFNKFRHLQEFRKISSVNAVIDGMISMGASIAALQAAAHAFISPAGAFAAASTKKHITPDFYEDDTHIYETEKVSRETYTILTGEVKRMRKLEHDLDEVEDQEMLAIIQAEIGDLADTLEMRLHPVSGKYVHSLERVEAEEVRLNSKGDMECNDTVCVFRPKFSTHDSRKRSVVLGDQYDQQTIEVIATDSDNVIAEARPIAPPGFHHS